MQKILVSVNAIICVYFFRRIFYGTRTHKQITHIVKELGRTPFHKVKWVF